MDGSCRSDRLLRLLSCLDAMVGLGQLRSAFPEEISLGCTKPPVDCLPSLGVCNPARCGPATNSPRGCRSAAGQFATTSNVYGNWTIPSKPYADRAATTGLAS